MNRVIMLFLLVALLSTGCAPATPSIGAPASPTAKLVPTTAPTAPPTPTGSPTPLPSIATATLAPSTTTPAVLSATPSPTPPAAQSGSQFAPDCATFPGFPTCGKDLPLKGRLALLDAARQVVRIYDFGTRIALEIKIGAGIQRIAWLDQGNYLVTYDGSGKATLAWANPVLSKMPLVPPLSPDGTPVFIATDGSSAWLDAKFTFHIRLAGSEKEQLYPAEAQPSDKIHQLLGWVPGTKWLLAGYHFSSNSMWVNGNRLYTLEASNGTIKELPANLPLNGVFRWHPSQAGLMVYQDSNNPPVMGEGRPATLQVNGGKPAFLVSDELVTSGYPAWLPDGKAVLFAARKLGGAVQASDPFALAAIYLSSYPAGTARRLTQPAAGERDDWPQLLADGVHFLYLRTSSDGKSVTLRLGAIDGSLDGLVASGLSSPAPSEPLAPSWDALIAYAP